MNNTLMIFVISAVLLVMGVLGNEMGLTTTLIVMPEVTEPGGGVLDGILMPFVWAFNAVWAIIQMMTFQAQIPPLVNTIIFGPVIFLVFYMVLNIIRGTKA